jgi:hypothetical protein
MAAPGIKCPIEIFKIKNKKLTAKGRKRVKNKGNQLQKSQEQT